jgi:type I restriction enzyme S subunit
MSKWVKDKIGNVSDSFAGGTPSRSRPDYFNGEIPWISSSEVNLPYIDDTKEKITELGLENSSAKWIPKNSVLVAMYGATAGVVSKLLINATSNQAVLALVPYKDKIDGGFLYYQVKQNKEGILFLAQGSGQPNLSKDLIDNYEINFPISVSEQHQIATILSTADAVIEKTQAAIAKYKAIKQGMLQDLFTRGIDTTTGKLRPSYQDAPELYKESKLGLIPIEWSEEIFGEQIELVHGHQFRNYDFTEFGVAVVKIGQVKPENVDLSNCSFVSADRMEEFRNETIRNGDVLMALTGATLGKACLVSGLSNPVLQNYRVGRFEPKIKENDIDKSFLYYTLTAGELLNQIFNKVNSGAQGNIGKADFEKAFFKKPPFTEQKLIAERLNSLNQKLQTEQDFLHKQQQIKAGLMNDLLSGKKQVTIKENQMT